MLMVIPLTVINFVCSCYSECFDNDNKEKPKKLGPQTIAILLQLTFISNNIILSQS